VVFSTTYSKKARVEAMDYLYEKGDLQNMFVEYSHTDGVSLMPVFYTDNWRLYYPIGKKTDWDLVVSSLKKNEERLKYKNLTKPVPNYVVFLEDKKLDQRVSRVKKSFPSLEFEAKIEAGWFDSFLHNLNPNNRVEVIYIYKIH